MMRNLHQVVSLNVAAVIAIGLLSTAGPPTALAQAWDIASENPLMYPESVAYDGADYGAEQVAYTDSPCGDAACGDACCNECECCDIGNCCCDVCPRWTVRAGAVILQRSRPGDGVVIENTVSGDTIENFSNFSFDMEAGPDLYLKRRGNFIDWDFRFFMVDNWNSELASRTSPIWNFPWDPPLFGLGQADVVSLYRSKLYSSEINARRSVSRGLDIMAGFRYLALDERIDVQADFGGNEALVWTEATNDLYGFQLGGEGVIWDRGGWIRFENTIKGGLYYNAAGSASGVIQSVGPAFGTDGLGSSTAFLGEYDINAVFRLTPCLALRIGYQLMFLEGVAVLNDQYPKQDVLRGSQVDTHGGPFYHGATVALEAAW